MSDHPRSPSARTRRRKANRVRAGRTNVALDGDELHAARAAAGLTVTDLATAVIRDTGSSLSKTKRLIRDVEYSPSYQRYLTVPVARRYADALGVPVDAITLDRPPQPPEPIADDGIRHLSPRARALVAGRK